FVFVTAPPSSAVYTLSLHDALPICGLVLVGGYQSGGLVGCGWFGPRGVSAQHVYHRGNLCWWHQLVVYLANDVNPGRKGAGFAGDRKSTRLNSSHVSISYAVFCLKK